jgi:hypothetical protein
MQPATLPLHLKSSINETGNWLYTGIDNLYHTSSKDTPEHVALLSHSSSCCFQITNYATYIKGRTNTRVPRAGHLVNLQTDIP